MNDPIFFIDDPDFETLDAADLLSLPEGISLYSDQDCTTNDFPENGDFEVMRGTPLLSPQGEVFLFRKMNFLLRRAEETRRQLVTAKSQHAKLRKCLEHALADADAVRNHIAECNLRLVISIARKFANSSHEFDELTSEGNEILLKSIAKFDASRGFRFSTYATHSVQRHFFRLAQRRRRRQPIDAPGTAELLHGVAAVDEDPLISEWIQEEHRVNDLIARMAEQLDEREQVVVRGRFGIGNNGVVKTLRELAQELGLSKERVRQLQIAAVEKLRDLFDECSPDLAAS
ncbi:MAG: sigma-70 family RNA polymerase sigma factor [Planctomycetaceae bacterium]